MPTYICIENVTFLPKSAARIAANLLVLQSYPALAQSFRSVRNVGIENVSQISAWRGHLNTLGTGPNALTADILSGQDTYGWPLEAFEPPTFLKPWTYNQVILNSFSTYNVATDVRRAKQALFFQEPESFLKPWRSNVVVLNTFIPYVPSTDVRRAKQALYFQEPETFFRPMPYNALVINGTAAFATLNIPPWRAAWTADSTAITADSTKFTADGADLINGGGLSLIETPPFESPLSVNITYNLRY